MTQQQLADAVGVSFQAVSKWETGISAPDIGTLPEIADFFDVTIDDLFKSPLICYKNKAQRLMVLYEADQDNAEAFDKADAEYKKLFAGDHFDVDDLGSYAYLNDLRARYYLRTAEHYYLDAIERGAKKRDEIYYKLQRQYILFLSRLGRSNESILRHARILEQEPDHPMNYSTLVSAYKCAGDLEKAYEVSKKGLKKFPDDAMLLVFSGDTCEMLGKHDEAIACWEKSYAMDPEMVDTRYSIIESLLKQNRKEEAEKILEQIIEWNARHGYDIENRGVKSELNKLLRGNPETAH
jgi:transcriptional regulator with XRE-family HTH domain